MGLRSLKEQIDLALKARRAWNQLEDDMESKEFDWLIAIKEGSDFDVQPRALPAIFAFLLALRRQGDHQVPRGRERHTAYIGLIVLSIRFAVRAGMNAFKNHPDFAGAGRTSSPERSREG